MSGKRLEKGVRSGKLSNAGKMRKERNFKKIQKNVVVELLAYLFVVH